MAARGHFISWVEMLRFLRGRRFRDAEVTRQVAGIAQSIYSAARRNASHHPEDVGGYLEAADDAASWAKYGRAIMLTDGGSETFKGLDGSFYVTAGGMGGPWSLTVEATD